jgi:ribose-phosphate pyrophosphokinase
LEDLRLLYTVGSYAYLERDFLATQRFDRGTIERSRFPNGERYLRLVTDPMGRDVVLLGGTPGDEDWLEVYDLACALAHDGARSLAIVMPYFGYATMDRAVLRGEVVTAKNRARLLSAVPRSGLGTRVFLLDLHTDGIVFYFGDRLTTHHVYGSRVIGPMIRSVAGAASFVVGAADAGRATWAQRLATDLGVDSAFVYKRRDPVSGEPRVTGINADVRGKEVVIYDDMIRTGATVTRAGIAYLDAGATKVHAVVTHLALTETALAELDQSKILASVSGTNSHPGSQELARRGGRVSSIAELMIHAIERF